MDHLRFQSSQTAASYVAAQLDAQEQEAFELHMMSCPECVGEVESWRALQQHLPGERRRRLDVAEAVSQADLTAGPVSETVAPSEPQPVAVATRAPRWRMAVSLAAVAIVGAAGGWFARSAQEPWAADETAFYALRPIGRGAEECQTLRLDKGTSVVALRVASTAPDQELAAVDGNGRDLARARFMVRTQADGSWVARLRAESLSEPVRFEGRSADGTVEPLGCVVSAPRG